MYKHELLLKPGYLHTSKQFCQHIHSFRLCFASFLNYFYISVLIQRVILKKLAKVIVRF